MDTILNPEVSRSFSALYIPLDLLWLAGFISLLWWFRRRTALVVGLIAGAIYFAVDYGIFYRLLDTRAVSGADPFWLLLWLSFSYGLTNFAWIWVLLSRDRRQVEWSVLIVTAWVGLAFAAQAYGSGEPIQITRGTHGYHGAMAAILAAGYATLVVHNLRGGQAPLLRLMAIGIGVQFAWEAVLLLSDIRPASLQPLVINSLIETNLGLPYAWLIHRWASRRWPDAGATPGD